MSKSVALLDWPDFSEYGLRPVSFCQFCDVLKVAMIHRDLAKFGLQAKYESKPFKTFFFSLATYLNHV